MNLPSFGAAFLYYHENVLTLRPFGDIAAKRKKLTHYERIITGRRGCSAGME